MFSRFTSAFLFFCLVTSLPAVTFNWTPTYSVASPVTSGNSYSIGFSVSGTSNPNQTPTITKNGAFFCTGTVTSGSGGGGKSSTDTGNQYITYTVKIDSTTYTETVKVALPDSGPPTVPGNLSVVNATNYQLTIGWSPSTDDVVVDHYNVTATLNGQLVSSGYCAGTSNPSATLSSLAKNTSYLISVTATDFWGHTSTAGTFNASTQNIDDVPPSNITGSISFTNITQSSCFATWNAATDDRGTPSYKVVATPSGGTGQVVLNVAQTGSPTTGCIIGGLQPATYYAVTIVAVDAAGNQSTQAVTGSFTTSAPPNGPVPSAPFGVAVTPYTNFLTLYWSPAIDNHPVAKYVVYYNDALTNTTVNATSPTSVTTTQTDGNGHILTYCTVSGLLTNHPYNFVVQAVDPSNNVSPLSTQQVFATQAALAVLPASNPPPGNISGALVGTTGASVSVDNHGDANLSVPLKIPPGRAGLQPDLSLVYSSSGGDGLVGVGFSVATGFPQSISRGRSIMARDGVTRGVTFSSTDNYYLDGKRLLLMTGTLGQPGSTYRTEVDSFQTIITTGSGQSIDAFVVTDKLGRQFTFGKTTSTIDAYQQGGGEYTSMAYSYALKTVTDTIGNVVTFNYTNLGGGEYQLSEIDYTGGVSTAAAKILFAFVSRPDARKTYVAGRAFEHRARLDSITTQIGGTTAAYYALSYVTTSFYGTPSGNSRLNRITSYLLDPSAGTLKACPPTTLAWKDVSPQLGTDVTAGGVTYGLSGNDLAQPGNFQGDGKDYVLISGGGQFVGDFDGDGVKEKALGGPGGFSVTFASGVTWTIPNFSTAFNDPGATTNLIATTEGPDLMSRIVIGDFNGDGRDDVLVHGIDGCLYLYTSNGSGFNSLQKTPTPVGGVGQVGFQSSWTLQINNFVSKYYFIRPIPCDLNGDGITDYVFVQTSRNIGMDVNNTSQVANYSNVRQVIGVLSLPGGGFSAPFTIDMLRIPMANKYVQGQGNIALKDLAAGVLVGDFNGDGKTDFLIAGSIMNNYGHWTLRLSKGDSYGGIAFDQIFTPIPDHLGTGRSYFKPASDGTDGDPDNAWAAYSAPAGIFAPASGPIFSAVETSGGTANGFIYDVNGDGLADYVWYNGSSWSAMLSTGEFSSGTSNSDGTGTNGSGFIGPVHLTFLDAIAGGKPIQQNSNSSFTSTNISPGADFGGLGHPGFVVSYTINGRITQTNLYSGAGATFTDTLTSVTDGLGRTTSLGYLAAKDPAIYTSGTNAGSAASSISYPIRNMWASNPVVSDLYQDSGNATPAHFGYQYSGNRLDLSGRGSLGFHSFVTVDTQTGLFKYQFLAQSFPMTGLAVREQTHRFWSSGSTANFRLLSSHDNTVVFDEVVNSGGTPYGTLYPFISKAVESRWEDGSSSNETLPLGTNPEGVFTSYATPPPNPYITITAQSLFDNQTAPQTTFPVGLTGFNPSDTASNGMNTVTGANASLFTALPGKITYGNLMQLSTDYGDGFTDKVLNSYLSPIGNLTGLVNSTVTTATSSYGTDSSPTKTYTYAVGAVQTPLVATETSTPAEAALKFKTTYQRDSSLRVTETDITDFNTPGTVQYIGSYAVSKENTFNSTFDLPTKTFDAYGHETDIAYDSVLGLPTSVTDPNLAIVQTTYDALGRPVKVVDNLTNLETDTNYSLTSPTASDWTLTQTVAPPASVTSWTIPGLTGTSVYAVQTTTTVKPTVVSYYDRLGRVVRVSKLAFDGSQTLTDTIYDALGRTVAASLPYTSGKTAYWTTTAYDNLGRVATVTAPNGTVTTNTYIGRVTQSTVTPVSGTAETNSTYVDARGHTIAVWNADNLPLNPDPKTGSTTTASIAFKLDGFGRMRETDLLGQTAPIYATYDGLGHQITLNDPDKGSWSYLNNALGEVVTQTDAKTNVTQSTFDNLRRPLTRTTTETSGAVETANWYYYDTADNATIHQVAKGTQGWLLAPQREDSTTTGALGYGAPTTTHIHYYDAKGRPFINVSSVDGKWFYTYNGYDTYSRVNEIHHYWRPGTHEAATDQPYAWMDFGYLYTYDGNSYLTKLTDSSTRVWWQADSTLGYDYLDRPVKVQKGSGHWTTRTYNPTDGTLTAISTPSVQNLSFGYDGLGNLTSRGDAIAGVNETFQYDVLNRLTTATNGATATTTAYLQNGNIQSKKDVNNNASGTYVYNAAQPHAVTSAFGYTMTYDANGNLATRSGSGHNWNTRWAGFDKPRWLAMDSSGNEFSYNANRSRVINLEFDAFSTAPTHYSRKRLYALGDTMEIDYLNSAPSGQSWKMDKVRIYVPGPDGTIGSMEFLASSLPAQSSGISLTDAQRAEVYHYDNLGSITAITEFGDASTNIALDNVGRSSLYGYSPWGERRSPTSGAGSPTTTTHGGHDDLTPRGFTSHEMLDTIGLVHMNGRIYDPLLGRMLSADVVVQFPGSLQSYNRYSYVINNPLTFKDPTGFQVGVDDAAVEILLAGGAVTAGYAATPQGQQQVTSIGQVAHDLIANSAEIAMKGQDPEIALESQRAEIYQQAASQQVSKRSDNQSTAPRPAVADVKPKSGKDDTIKGNGGGSSPNDNDPNKKKITNPDGRNGSKQHQEDVAQNNRQETGDLVPQKVGSRVPDGVGQQGQQVAVRGQTVDPGKDGRIIVESDKINQNGQVNSAGRQQVRDIRSADPKSTIIVTDHTDPNKQPTIYPPKTQPPPRGHLPAGTPTHEDTP